MSKTTRVFGTNMEITISDEDYAFLEQQASPCKECGATGQFCTCEEFDPLELEHERYDS